MDSIFTTIFDVIFGSGVNVANFYGIDPNSGGSRRRDGAGRAGRTADGVSKNGALYLSSPR